MLLNYNNICPKCYHPILLAIKFFLDSYCWEKRNHFKYFKDGVEKCLPKYGKESVDEPPMLLGYNNEGKIRRAYICHNSLSKNYDIQQM